jgi:hypothetical protein
MPTVRVYYEQSSGAVVQIEHRPDEQYEDSTLAAHGEGVVSAVVADPPPANVPFDQLQVKDGKLRAQSRGRARKEAALRAPMSASPITDGEEGPRVDIEEQADAQRRIEEILRLDRSGLSDEEWLRLFREYMTLTGRF